MFRYLLLIMAAIWLINEGKVGLLLVAFALWFCFHYAKQGYGYKVSETDIKGKVLLLLEVFYDEYRLGPEIGLDANGSNFIECFCVPLKTWAKEKELGEWEVIRLIEAVERLYPEVCYETKLRREVRWTIQTRKTVRKILECELLYGKPVPERLRQTSI